MDEGLHPVFEERTLSEGEYLYLVNYYGQLTDDKIRKYKKIYGNIIVDHTHAFFSETAAWRGHSVFLQKISRSQ